MTTDEYRDWVADRVEAFRKHCEKWGGNNQVYFHVFYVSSLLLAAGTTISGALKHSTWALVLGAISTAIAAYRSQWKSERNAQWYGAAQNQCRKLQADLVIMTTDAEIKSVSDQLEALRSGDQFWGKTIDITNKTANIEPRRPQVAQRRANLSNPDLREPDPSAHASPETPPEEQS